MEFWKIQKKTGHQLLFVTLTFQKSFSKQSMINLLELCSRMGMNHLNRACHVRTLLTLLGGRWWVMPCKSLLLLITSLRVSITTFTSDTSIPWDKWSENRCLDTYKSKWFFIKNWRKKSKVAKNVKSMNYVHIRFCKVIVQVK